MKAARQVLARFASKIVPFAKTPAFKEEKSVPAQLDTEQLHRVGGGLPRGSW